MGESVCSQSAFREFMKAAEFVRYGGNRRKLVL